MTQINWEVDVIKDERSEKPIDIKIGDKLAYVKYDISNWQSYQDVDWGYVYYVGEDKVGLARYQQSPASINTNSECEKLYYIDSETKNQMTALLNSEIDKLKNNIRELTHEEKDTLIANEFNRIKQEVTNVAANMIQSDNESSYINRLKEICRLKDKLFSIKVNDLENVHKKNGTIMYKVKQLQELLKKIELIEFE